MEDADRYPEFRRPMRCYDPNPLIEPLGDEGDCEPCRGFLADLCAYVEPVFAEMRA
ncbi:MAG TPA: hypothetical protein VEY12_07635 [Thermoplasmata archaeon]|nr:hypothetical protein [Thermoplasmata archaeon]